MAIVRPAVDPERYRTTPGNHATLVNLNDAKGGRVFWRLAKAMPHQLFLGVRGGYGEQVGFPATRTAAQVAALPRNVTLQWPTANMRDDVYARTRVLLMPSSYESWGRVAVEAMASGIPVMAHPTPGLLECLGDAGTFVDRDDLAGWVQAIDRLRGQAAWEHASRAAYARSLQLPPEPELDTFASVVHALAEGRTLAHVTA
jgi:glycosyltransferase involved in cell wall biosynthesis